MQPRSDELAFSTWYSQEHTRILAALVLVAGDLELARDAVDEAFCRALARWGQVGQLASPTGWVYTVALNVHRRTMRRVALEHRLLARLVRPAEVPPPAGEAWQLVGDLPLRQRTMVVLRHVAALREHEIAEILGVTRGTVSRTLRAAHDRLGDLLDERPCLVDDGREDTTHVVSK